MQDGKPSNKQYDITTKMGSGLVINGREEIEVQGTSKDESLGSPESLASSGASYSCCSDRVNPVVLD